MRKVIFAHGMEGSPQGTKATYLGSHLKAFSPFLGDLGLERQIKALGDALPDSDPAVLVGSSLGALAALGAATRYPAKIAHLVLLAPAVGVHLTSKNLSEAELKRPGIVEEISRFSAMSVPREVPSTLIYGLEDDVVRIEDVLALLRRSPSACAIFVHDDHALSNSRELILATAGRAASEKGEEPTW